MKAGRMRHRCSLLVQERVGDGVGGYREEWVELRKVWAEITTPTGRVAVAAQQLTAEVAAEVRCRPADDLQAGRRLVARNVTYRIEAVLPDNFNSMVRMLCSSVPHP